MWDGAEITVAEELLRPSVIYTPTILKILEHNPIKSIAHITGGGLIENPPRSFSRELTLNFNMENYQMPSLFEWIKEKANISLYEMLKTFNCGIGLLIFVDKSDAKSVINDINNVGYDSFLIGSMEENKLNKHVVFDGWGF